MGATTGAWPHCPQPRPDARLRLVCLPSAQLVVPLTEAVPGQVRPPVLRRDHPTLSPLAQHQPRPPVEHGHVGWHATGDLTTLED